MARRTPLTDHRRGCDAKHCHSEAVEQAAARFGRIDVLANVAEIALEQPLIPRTRLGRPEEVAGIFAFLASEDAGVITGETILMDGGQLAIDGRKLHAWDDI